MVPADSVMNGQFTPSDIVSLSVLATVGIVVMWAVFWFAAARSSQTVKDILSLPAFFETVAVIGVIAASVVLSLAGRLEGHITGAILSGIVGYVLGQLSGRDRRRAEKEQQRQSTLG